nr:hypothetical protein CFP56_09368 [Quercus suber]
MWALPACRQAMPYVELGGDGECADSKGLSCPVPTVTVPVADFGWRKSGEGGERMCTMMARGRGRARIGVSPGPPDPGLAFERSGQSRSRAEQVFAAAVASARD